MDIPDNECTDEELATFFKRPKVSVTNYSSEVVSSHFEYPSIKNRITAFLNWILQTDMDKVVCQAELCRNQRKEDDDFYDVYSLIIWERIKSKRREVWIVKDLIEEHVT